MKSLTINRDLIRRFQYFLDRMQYHLLLTIVLGESAYFTNPLPDYNLVKYELKKLDERHQDLFSFLFLGEPISRNCLQREIDIELLDYLYDIEIINRDEKHYWMNNYVLTSYCNCYFLVSNVFYYPTCQSIEQKPYIGVDTYWLSRAIINKAHGMVLDLCTGSGIQAILAAKTADKVVAIDIDEQSLKIAEFNAFLNALDEKIEFRHGNLYERICKHEAFDLIISNPPFIPIPKEINFHVCGDGGEDGANIIRKILLGYSQHLKPEGQAIMIGQCIGTNDRPFIIDNINFCIKELDTTVVINGKTVIESQAIGFADLSSKYNEKQIPVDLWMKMYKSLHVEYLYTFTLFVNNHLGEHKKVVISDTWSKNDVPNINIANISKHSEAYSVKNDKNQTYVLDDEAIAFIKLVDGNKTFNEIVDLLPFKYKLKYGNNGTVKQKVRLASLCSQLERHGLLTKTNLELSQKKEGIKYGI